MAVLNVTKDEDGSGLDHEVDRSGVPPRSASLAALKQMMTHHKHITQYKLYTKSQSSDWWIDLATFMSHLTRLSIFVGIEDEYIGDSAIVLMGLPNLTCLILGGACGGDPIYGACSISSLSLHLPALQTFTLNARSKSEPPRAMWLCELDIECPSLYAMRCTFRAELAMTPSWFAHLQSLYLTLPDVRQSGCI